MAVDGYWATGPGLIYTYTGAVSAQELLGYTESGAEVEITKNYKEVFSDVFGPLTPIELQDFGEVAIIRVPLIAVDRAVLNKVLNRGNRGANGQLNTPGRFVGLGGDSFRVGIAAANDVPYSFPNCVVRPAQFPMTVVAKPFNLTFFAWPYLPYTATTGLNTILYNRTLA